MSVLNEKGISIICNALELAGDSVIPVYLHDDVRFPSLWRGDRAILVINWDDVPRTITVEGIDESLISNKEYRLENGALSVSLLPHESFAAKFDIK